MYKYQNSKNTKVFVNYVQLVKLLYTQSMDICMKLFFCEAHQNMINTYLNTHTLKLALEYEYSKSDWHCIFFSSQLSNL